jgi:lauroyl/myristoyl acyltransferase
MGHLYTESIRTCDIVASLDVRPILSAMEANQILLIAGDGLRATEFKTFPVLGNDYPIPTGFVKIALVTGATVLPVFSTPEKGRIRTTIHPPLRLDSNERIETNLQGYVDVLNEQLLRTPHLWLRWNRANWFEKARKWAEEAKADPFGMKPAWLAED